MKVTGGDHRIHQCGRRLFKMFWSLVKQNDRRGATPWRGEGSREASTGGERPPSTVLFFYRWNSFVLQQIFNGPSCTELGHAPCTEENLDEKLYHTGAWGKHCLTFCIGSFLSPYELSHPWRRKKEMLAGWLGVTLLLLPFHSSHLCQAF